MRPPPPPTPSPNRSRPRPERQRTLLGPSPDRRRGGHLRSKSDWRVTCHLVRRSLTAPQEASSRDADDVERHPCPHCRAEPGSPCRARSGAVAGTYHTGCFTKAPRLAKLLRVPTPADRGPGQPWRPGTPVPLALAPDTPSADIRIGYARCSTLAQELQSQLDALAKHGIPRDKARTPRRTTAATARSRSTVPPVRDTLPESRSAATVSAPSY
ncbi:zinc finger domain-containing protein [Streptomyces avermitilis]|uniref:zinc finger domain-containing protein n=1 Tax=Streptomyces avermitilis TaxID=33903 RepID=UPI003F4BAC6B